MLFNLYGFNEYFSSNEKAPTLVLRECEFMYFLYDYESLINVETNNLYRPYKRPDSKDPFNYYYY